MKPRIRPKVRKMPEVPAGELFPLPEVVTQSAPTKRRATSRSGAPARKNRGKAAQTAEQPFLPGLSRRGRPRLPNPVPASERATKSRNKRIEAGAKRIELMLPPEVADNLDVLADFFKESRAEVVSRLVAKAAKRLPK